MPRVNYQDPYRLFVQDQMTPGVFGSGEFLMIAAGPPLLAGGSLTEIAGGGDFAFPIGIVQNFNLSQNMALARVFELGSKRSYMFPGKVIGAVSFARPYYHAHSLLRLLMAYYSSKGHGVEVKPVFANSYTTHHTIRVSPGYENFFINLASDLFSQPHGELICMRDTTSRVIQTFYLEQAYIPSHTLAVDAQGLVYQEAVQVQYERLVPVRVSGMVEMADPNNVFDDDRKIAGSEMDIGAAGGGISGNLSSTL